MLDRGISFCIIPTSDPHGSEYIAESYKYREYITGFTGSAGSLVVSRNEAALFVDGRYHLQADRETEGSCIKVFKLGLKDVPSYIQYLDNNSKTDDIIAFNGRLVMQSELKSMQNKLKDVQFSIEDDLVSEVIKMPDDSFNSVIDISDEISGESVSEKIKKVRSFISENKADGLFISALDDVCWLFNIRGRDVEYSTVAFSYAYITEDSATLYIRKDTYDKSLSEKLENEGVFICDYKDIELELFKLKGKRILADPEFTSSYFVKIIELGNELIECKNHEVIKKHIKNITEQNIAKAKHITDAVAVCEFIAQMKESPASDEYLAAKTLDELRRKSEDFYDLSFETISAYAENAAVVHYSAPSVRSKKLQKKGLILVDSGAHYMGATTDITRTFALGETTDEEKRAFTLVLKGNLRLMNAVFLKGTRCENLDILARGPLWKEGLDYRHGTGHGVGAFLNVHEGPYRINFRINNDISQPAIEAGMIISDEPGYYKSGAFGIRHETQLLCVEKTVTEYGEFLGFEPLTLVPFDMTCIILSMLNDEEKESLNNYNFLIREKVVPLLSERAAKWALDNTIKI